MKPTLLRFNLLSLATEVSQMWTHTSEKIWRYFLSLAFSIEANDV